MRQLHDALIGKSLVSQGLNLRVGHGSRIIVDLKCVLQNRSQPVTFDCVQPGLQQPANVVLGGAESVIENRAKRRGAVGASVGLRHQNTHVLDFFHGELAHFP